MQKSVSRPTDWVLPTCRLQGDSDKFGIKEDTQHPIPVSDTVGNLPTIEESRWVDFNNIFQYS